MPGTGLQQEMAERIVVAVDELWEEQLEFTRELVRFPSVRGQEHTAQGERRGMIDPGTVEPDIGIRDLLEEERLVAVRQNLHARSATFQHLRRRGEGVGDLTLDRLDQQVRHRHFAHRSRRPFARVADGRQR